MGRRNEAASWWSPKAAAAWERLATEIDKLERTEQERDQAARRYLAALMAALREGRPAPNMGEFDAFGRGGGEDPQYDPGPGGGTTGVSPPDGQTPVWQPSDYPAVPGSPDYARIAQEGDESGRGVTVGSAVSRGASPGPVGLVPGVVGLGPIVGIPVTQPGFDPPHPLPTADPQPTQPGYTPGAAPTLPGYTPGPGYTPEPGNRPGDFGATPVIGSGPYLNNAGAATAVPPPTATPPQRQDDGEADSTPLPWQHRDDKKTRQAPKRGWSDDDIDDVLEHPAEIRPAINYATGNAATVYYRPDGHYVARDDVTGDIFHVSDRNKPDWKDPEGGRIRPR